ncbi:Surface presentation of antigens protein SpaR [Halodesulfovibrio sp. MK-HDV]|jgi:flagellar biosynthesis protein FliR|nr:flagellar biosynthetic protein FliR [Halodesulfovibrio sp. MK-HDV]KAF1075978.1 Surface presentation of antigens protein SpaR [Halodesulfovibrio sp. MK-HDV]
MDIFNFDMAEFLSFLLTLMRLSLVVFLLPFFEGKTIPRVVKASVCLMLTLAIFPSISFEATDFPAHPFEIALIMLSEILLGVLLGLAVKFIFAGIRTGGMVIGFQMGFSMLTLANPSSGEQEGITSILLYQLSFTVFIVANGHLYLIKALTDSFDLIPPGGLVLSAMLGQQILTLSMTMFVLAIKVAAPVMISLMLVELTLGLMGRAAPQMNLLMLGFPVKIAVGLVFIGMLFTLMGQRMEGLILSLGPMFSHLMKAGSPLLQQ